MGNDGNPDPATSLTFFVELGGDELRQLFERPGVLEHLRASRSSVAMAMLDLSAQRELVIRRLNAHRVPVTAWLVLEEAQGYWLTADNAEEGLQRYLEVNRWIRLAGLEVEAVGLDIETPQEDSLALMERGLGTLRRLFRRRRRRSEIRRAALKYTWLVERIRAEGYRVETYQFPLILDERQVGSTLLQRTLGIVDVAPDREVVMLYRSLLPPMFSDALIDAFGAEAEAIGVGITGGGVQKILDLLGARLLDLGRLLTDLRRARRYTPHLYVFSLEGCVEAGYFEELCRADLDIAVPPSELTAPARVARGGLRTVLRAEGIWDLLSRRL